VRLGGLLGLQLARAEDGLVPLGVDLDEVVGATLLLRPLATLLLARHPLDYAPTYATRPSRTTVWTTCAARRCATCRQSGASLSTRSARRPTAIRPRSWKPRTCAALTVDAARPSSGAGPSWVHARVQTTGRLSQNALPGLKSVASAITAPASA